MKTENKIDNVKIQVAYGVNGKIPENMKNMNPYTVTLSYKGKQWTTNFFTGYGWTKEPNAKDVVSSLLSDASCYESSRNFEDFCADLGYDSTIYDEYTGRAKENKEAKRIYEACAKTAERIKRFFGDDLEQIQEEMQDY